MNKRSGILLLSCVLAACANHPPAPVVDRGQTLSVSATPVEKAAPAVVEVPPGYYQVKRGDNLLRISLDHGQYYKDVAAWNNLEDPNKINAGQLLRVVPPEGAVVVKPVAAPPVIVAADTLKREPKGGTQPYSDEAYAKARGETAPAQPVEKPAEKPAEKPVAPAPAATPAPEAVVWAWPYAGKTLATFSEGTENANKGIDIAGKPGDAVQAAAPGKVVYAGSGLRGYGNLVIVKHDSTYLSAYAHNSKILVKEGDTVSRGQKIAEVGSSDADQPKLHFEIRKLGKPVDPLTYLPKR